MKSVSALLHFLGALWVLPWTLVGFVLAAASSPSLAWHPRIPALVATLRSDSWLRQYLFSEGFGGLTVGNVVLVAESWYLSDNELLSDVTQDVRQQMLWGPLSFVLNLRSLLF